MMRWKVIEENKIKAAERWERGGGMAVSCLGKVEMERRLKVW